MEHLWAPWRMAYISSGAAAAQGCIFCTKPAAENDVENLILYRGSLCFVMMNLFPYNSGHVMVAPYAHVDSVEKFDEPTLLELMKTVQMCLKAIRKTLRPDAFNMGINEGSVAGASFAGHTHYHIVPRWNGDTNFMPVLGEVKVLPDFLQNTYNQIKAALLTV